MLEFQFILFYRKYFVFLNFYLTRYYGLRDLLFFLMMYGDNIVFPNILNKIILTSWNLCLIYYFMTSHKWVCFILLGSSTDHNCALNIFWYNEVLSFLPYLFLTVLLPSKWLSVDMRHENINPYCSLPVMSKSSEECSEKNK